ncbi:MAG: caspase family protein [Rhodobacteraceae bacterium]|nr:caspase family protein [Paracoccaceae bacterium]
MVKRTFDRIAFIVGNSAYDGQSYLKNPVNDAELIGETLTGLGFKVLQWENLDPVEMEQRFSEFADEMKRQGGVDTALIYYSGHGVQMDDTNYLIPVGEPLTESLNLDHLFSVQDMIDRTIPLSRKRLVFLDACRDDPRVQKLQTQIGQTRNLSITRDERGFKIDGQELRRSAFEAENNTFLAFAAAPGHFARDGMGEHSPFTTALARHIQAVDLPLSNLMMRVRNDVLEMTQEFQKTWDHSSLTDPYYFRPGELLLLTGNFIGLVAALFSLAPMMLVMRAREPASMALVAAALTVLALALFLTGVQKAYSRLRGAGGLGNGPPDNWARFRADFRQGSTGGAFGGLIAAFLIAGAYYLDWTSYGTDFYDVESFGWVLTEITVAAIFVASPLGGTCVAFVRTPAIVRAVEHRPRFGRRRDSGIIWVSILAGTLVGVIVAPLVTLYFGRMNRPPVLPLVLAPGAVVGTAVIAFAIVNYNLEKFTRLRLKKSLLAAIQATGVAGLAAAVVFGFLTLVGFVQHTVGAFMVEYQYYAADYPLYGVWLLLFAGFIWGILLGPILGLLIGWTLTRSGEAAGLRA